MKISTARLKQIIHEELFYREFHRGTEELAEGSGEETVRGDLSPVSKQSEREAARLPQHRATAGADFVAEQKRIRDSKKWWLAGDPVRIYIPNTVEPDAIKKWLDDNASDYIIGGALEDAFYIYEPHPVDVIKQAYQWDPAAKTMVDIRETK